MNPKLQTVSPAITALFQYNTNLRHCPWQPPYQFPFRSPNFMVYSMVQEVRTQILSSELSLLLRPKIFVFLLRHPLSFQANDNLNDNDHSIPHPFQSTVNSHPTYRCHITNAAKVPDNNIQNIVRCVITSYNMFRHKYVGGSISFRPDIQRPRQMQNALRDI